MISPGPLRKKRTLGIVGEPEKFPVPPFAPEMIASESDPNVIP